jgi:hypothetical protein
MDGSGGSSCQRVRVARPGLLATPPVLIRPLGLVSLNSSSSCVSRDKILALQKSQVNMSPGRSLKLKNTQNRVFKIRKNPSSSRTSWSSKGEEMSCGQIWAIVAVSPSWFPLGNMHEFKSRNIYLNRN